MSQQDSDEDVMIAAAFVGDAHLIAAAPDLLAALKDATFALALIAQQDGNERYLNAAHAAIAKAEGRALTSAQQNGATPNDKPNP